ncbi:LytR/AlgR family response regulator transcription factor [Catalinimonas niigatensis]|uniref:LytR/AlgR family response regulator transcription factor n=1 Tax=Catalinimonas niigatensis TaxID=1397264 RepID=UPI002665BCAC|nr:LytTR family DNA-binding domain-containing protein [Catalinimonas niigatensis]WPP50873.1 LytTR family DNA-binding domain-containing protein [Catalinimonas niigatensis]
MKKRNWILIGLWIVFLLPIIFVIGITLSGKSSSTIEINQSKLDKILEQGDANDLVVVRNKNLVEITLTQEAVNKSEYRNLTEELNAFSINNGPHYHVDIANYETFDQYFTEIQENIPLDSRIGYRVEERSGIGSFVMNWGVIFGLVTTIPILMMWLVFKLFWSAKPREKLAQRTEKLSSKESELLENHQLNFPVKVGDRTIFLEMNRIVSFQAKDNYVNILDMDDHLYLTEYTLNELEEKLPTHFIRIHRSYIVNKLLIKEIRKHSGNKFTLLLNSKKSQQLVSSQSYAPKIKEMMKI